MPIILDVKTGTPLHELEYIRIAADSSNDIITIAASDDAHPHEQRFLYANEGCARLFGYRAEDVVGSPITMFDGPLTDRNALTDRLRKMKLNESITAELMQYRRDGTSIWVELRIHATEMRADGRTVFVGVGRDISERRSAEAKINDLIRIDVLTGLFNRESLTEQLRSAIERARAAGKMTGVMHLDVDGFKDVNELYGRAQGDKLLVALGQRLKGSLRLRDVVARQSSDEFVIALPEIDAPIVAADIAKRIQSDLTSPFFIDDSEIYVSASIGISVHPADGSDVETLLRNANTALLTAKAQGRRQFRFYSPDMHSYIIGRLKLIQELRSAVAAKEFVVYYQPIVELKSGDIVGAEALVRWNHPTRGLLAPMDFIPAAEDAGLISLLGAQVLDAACGQLARWDARGLGELQIAVNISPRQIPTPGFRESIAAALSSHGIAPERLVLEVTESAMMADPKSAIEVLGSLRALGIKIALDDFGTGYSSLAWLDRLPKDTIKVDRSFVESLQVIPFDKSMADMIITIGHRLALNVVAEGVETVDQLAALREHGCDFGQGFFFSKPVAAESFEQLLVSQKASGRDT